MVKFSIIAVYYQGVTTDEDFERFLRSVSSQTFKDFELCIYHDGPKLSDFLPNVNMEYSIKYTKERRNLWGHDLRRQGILDAGGEFLLHTNCDNVYDSKYLERLNNAILRHDNPEKVVWVSSVKMMGLNQAKGRIYYDNPRDYSKYLLLSGNPPVYGNVDLMQVCISKKLWMKYGWFSYVAQADGIIYDKICKENPYVNLDLVCGEHY